MRLFFLSILVLLLFMPGCAKKVDLGPGYEMTSKKFLQAMRWKDFQGAAGYLKGEEGKLLLEQFEGMKDLNVVEADYHFSRLNKEDQTAESQLVLKYYMLPSTRIKEWSWDMDWTLLPADSQQRGTWQIEKAPPVFP